MPAGSSSPPPWLRAFVRRLEGDARLDPLVDRARSLCAPLTRPPLRPVLDGSWLGHAVHPLLTDIPIGCWTSTNVLDLIGGRAARSGARRLVALGVVSAVPTAVTGLSDWAAVEDDRRVQRVGLVHAAVNTSALGCYTVSWCVRRKGHHGRGALWALAGSGVATVAGYLGGHLAFARGTGVGAIGLDELAPTAGAPTPVATVHGVAPRATPTPTPTATPSGPPVVG